MAKLNFPTPDLNDPSTLTYTDAGITWTWNNTLGVWSSDLAEGTGGSAYWDRDDATLTLSPKTENDNIDIGTGTVTAGDGEFSGDVSGTFTGDLTGSVTGDVTGNVTGNVSGSSGSCTGNAATATTATNCSRQVVAGNGLSGGGVMDANRTISVGKGSGISVSSTTVGVDSTVERVNSTYIASIGSGAGPSHTFNGKTTNGMYYLDTNVVRVATNGTHRCSISSGNFTFPGIYSNTSSSGGEVYVNSDGRLRRKGSSRAYKTNIEPIDYSYAENILNNAQPVYYKPNVTPPEYPQAYLDMQQAQRDAGEADIVPDVRQCLEFCAENNIPWTMDDKWMNEGDDPNHSRWGFIAEDLAEVDPRLCLYDEALGRYDGVRYSELTPILLSICQKGSVI